MHYLTKPTHRKSDAWVLFADHISLDQTHIFQGILVGKCLLSVVGRV